MKVKVEVNYEELSRKAAMLVARQLLREEKTVLGLPTGATPKAMYGRLVGMIKEGFIDTTKLTVFCLDELYPLPACHPCSYQSYMRDLFVKYTNICPEKVHCPSSCTADPVGECGGYETEIRKAGGFDLSVLGLGKNGHIAFNEPGSDWCSNTRLVTLYEETRKSLTVDFGNIRNVPRQALTTGIKTIMNSKKIALLVSGISKAEIVAQVLKGPITQEVPASILQLHPQVTVILDHDAAHLL